MFTNQIQELRELQEGLEELITKREQELKEKKEELRDVKQGLSSLERIQAKYEVKEEDETVSLSV